MTRGRKPRRPRWLPTNTLTLARHRAGKLSGEELASVMRPLQAAFTAMRRGVATELDWSHLASAVNVAMAIEAQGIVKGLREHFTAAELAIAGIKRRAMDSGEWKPTALYYLELDALTTAIELHQFQLENLSHGEFNRALDHAEAEIRSTGGLVIQAVHTRAQHV